MDRNHSTTPEREKGQHLRFEDRCSIKTCKKLRLSLRKTAAVVVPRLYSMSCAGEPEYETAIVDVFRNTPPNGDRPIMRSIALVAIETAAWILIVPS